MPVLAAQQMGEGQLALYGRSARVAQRRTTDQSVGTARLCAGCRAREARYGFRESRRAERRSTLCFQCFRSVIGLRQDVAERIARGWNATQAGLPLADTLDTLRKRRRRAQIAARHALAD
jgi:hypothetical protein